MKLFKIGLSIVALTLGVTGVVSASGAEKIKPFSDPDNPYDPLNWTWPTTNSVISDGYGGSRNHKGIDIAVYKQPVYAAADGKVIFSGKYSDGAYTITIEHDDKDPNGNNLISRSIHLSRGTLLVSNGNYVDEGEKIATSGNTGASDPGMDNNYHLHWDVNNDGDDTPTFSDTINLKYFWPSKFSSIQSQQRNLNDHSDTEKSTYDDPERFFDQILINYVGESNFDAWFDKTEEPDRTLTNFKKHFKLSNKEIEKVMQEEIEKNKEKTKHKRKKKK